MACFHPLKAWQKDDGEIVFKADAGGFVEGMRGRPTSPHRELTLPCGQCIGCRLERSRQWAMRCMHEASLYDVSSFVTLTYSDENLPMHGDLVYWHFQDFMKRLRWKYGPVRFYMCGEYGSEKGRPHFHALLFGLDFSDKVLWRRLASGSCIYTSKSLEALWPVGFCSIGDVTFESAAYVARYCMKKVVDPYSDTGFYHGVTGGPSRVDEATGEVVFLCPEFNRMSLKPGIGAEWFRRYRADMHDNDYVVINGTKCKPPRYYDKLYMNVEWDGEAVLSYLRDRKAIALELSSDARPERLEVRERVTLARLAFKTRSL